MQDSSAPPLDLDRDLLDALDEMLSYTAPSDDEPIETGCHLADAFEPLVGIPSLPGQITTEPPSTPQNHQRKDVRGVPYVKPKPRRRKRPKDELDYLRAQVKTLQEELTNLSSCTEGNGATDPDEELFAQWKKIADRQKAEADRSMVENLKLRSILQGQLKVAKSLEAAIQKQQQEADELLSLHRVKAELNAIDNGGKKSTSLSDELIFSQLNLGLEAQYAEFDSVMDRTGLSKVLQNAFGIQTLDTPNGIAFRREEARLLPFTMPAVHRAIWSCMRYGKAEELTGRIHTHVVNNDHLNVTIIDNVQLPKSDSVDTCARLAMRRYFEPNRIIVVWSGYVEISGSLFVRLQERGYTSASAFDFSKNAEVSSCRSSSIPGCALRMALQIKPEMDEFGSQEEAKDHVGEVTDLVVGSYHRNFGLMYQIIENLLFRDSTGGEVDEYELARFAAY
ncbi:hypothetical protein DVH05_023362 [Phytophthora capsici]|nr:hypothetical protein DVH05_023362 [Phytophthora capsici]